MSKDWEIKSLQDLTTLLGDGLHGTPKYSENGEYFFINGNNLSNGKIIIKEKTKRVSLEEYLKYKKHLNERTVFVSINGTLGNVAFYNNEKVILGKSACYFNLLDIVDKYFIKYFLESPFFIKYAYSEATGATIKNVSLKSMRALNVPLPKTLNEQKQIVAILDKAFDAIDKAKENLEKNIQNSKELFQSRLNEIFSQKGEGWEEKKLEDLARDKKAIVSGPFGSNLKVADYRDSGVPIIRLQNVGKGQFIEKDIKYIDKEKAEELKSHSYVVGDIVLAKLGIPIGKTCIIPDSFEDGIILADIVRIRPDKGRVNYQFLEYFLNTDLSVSQLTKNISGATRPRVNLSNVRNIVAPIPSIDTQNKIVEEIDKLSRDVKQLETHYQQKLQNLEELKKSILQKAFSGELI